MLHVAVAAAVAVAARRRGAAQEVAVVHGGHGAKPRLVVTVAKRTLATDRPIADRRAPLLPLGRRLTKEGPLGLEREASRHVNGPHLGAVAATPAVAESVRGRPPRGCRLGSHQASTTASSAKAISNTSVWS